ncbi:hypothetical protein [Shewanella xiamenensis]|uniref:hypothetical protein n=1 Tax=Shewanella xiamenensis TaxID=332186 RepID=UPI0011869186|nr:hypothetical protein [Shewanella xiamenensis]TVL32442.1 hypothetical protein AYI95_09735 [Shewanella xiamenensis]UML92380.1 hypothetical protein MKD32_13115 [Shewanella xiamenensis]
MGVSLNFLIRCGRLSRAADRRMMATEMDISPNVLAKQLLDYAMKDINTNQVVKVDMLTNNIALNT